MSPVLLMYHIELLLGSSFLKNQGSWTHASNVHWILKQIQVIECSSLMKKAVVVVGSVTDIAFNEIKFAHSPKHANISRWYSSP